jgi:hypothetical protein
MAICQASEHADARIWGERRGFSAFSLLPTGHGLLRVIAQIGSRGLQPGDDAAIRLANGKNRIEVAGTAFSTKLSKVDVGGATRFGPYISALFKDGETLVVEVPGRKRSLPIANAGKSADAFLKACTATAAARQAPAG